jgi:hypothetical protein
VYIIREVPGNEKNLQFNGTFKILFYGNDANILNKTIILFVKEMEVGLSV